MRIMKATAVPLNLLSVRSMDSWVIMYLISLRNIKVRNTLRPAVMQRRCTVVMATIIAMQFALKNRV